jgi:hypothetical protein
MKHLQPFDEFVNEEALNEGDMTKLYDGFIVLDTKNQKQYKFKYVKGVKNVRIEDEAIAKLMKTTGLSRGNFGVYNFVKKGEWNDSEAEVLESLTNEGAMSDLDLMAREAKDFKAFVKEFTKKYHDLSNAGEPGQFENWLKSVYDSAKINEAIEIVYYSEVIDNWGKTESSEKPDAILKVLQTPDEWSDDMLFQDKGGRKYDIDELIGKQVKVGNKTILVNESKIFEAMDATKKIMNGIFRKNGIKTLSTQSSAMVKGWTTYHGKGYKYEYPGLISLKGFTIEEIEDLAKQFKDAGVPIDRIGPTGIEYSKISK